MSGWLRHLEYRIWASRLTPRRVAEWVRVRHEQRDIRRMARQLADTIDRRIASEVYAKVHERWHQDHGEHVRM